MKGFELSPEKYALAIAYRHEGYWLYFITLLYTLLLLWALVQLRVAPRLRTWAERVSHVPLVQLLLYGPSLLLIFGALLLPTDAYGHWHSRRFGVSVQNWSAWFRDWTAAGIATSLAGTLVIGLLYFTIRRSPQRWWFYLWLTGIPLAVLVVFAQPIAIDPLFDTFEPLGKTHPDLVNSAEKLLARAGLDIPPEHIYLAKVSDKTTAPDAYAEGLGPTKRIFIEDTIIASESSAAILHTVGHEIGHYTLAADWIAFGISVPVLLGLLYVIDRLFEWSLGRWGAQWNIRSAQDWASLPVLALIVALIAIALTPAANTLSRYREHEADRYGLELIHGIVPNGGEAAAQAFQKDGEIDLSDPAPPRWIVWLLFDHPPVNDRIVFCRSYDPSLK
jgi:STE24 endopeptidase